MLQNGINVALQSNGADATFVNSATPYDFTDTNYNPRNTANACFERN